MTEHRDAATTKAAVEKEGRRCLLIPGDVRDRRFYRAAVAQTLREFGRLDVLVNNAAFQVHTARFEELSEEHLDHTVKTNLYGYFYMAQAVVEHMEAGAAIVNTGSVTGLVGNKDLIDYSMTKGGIHAFTRSLATNLVGRGIRVNAVAPGPVWTPLNPSDKDPEKVAEFGSRTPIAGLRVSRVFTLLEFYHRGNTSNYRRLFWRMSGTSHTFGIQQIQIRGQNRLNEII